MQRLSGAGKNACDIAIDMNKLVNDIIPICKNSDIKLTCMVTIINILKKSTILKNSASRRGKALKKR